MQETQVQENKNTKLQMEMEVLDRENSYFNMIRDLVASARHGSKKQYKATKRKVKQQLKKDENFRHFFKFAFRKMKKAH